MKKVNYDIEFIGESGQVQTKNATAIIFRNVGDTDASISGIPLPAGETNNLFQCLENEVIQHVFQLKFNTNSLGENKSVVVIRKMVSDIPANEECKFKN